MRKCRAWQGQIPRVWLLMGQSQSQLRQSERQQWRPSLEGAGLLLLIVGTPGQFCPGVGKRSPCPLTTRCACCLPSCLSKSREAELPRAIVIWTGIASKLSWFLTHCCSFIVIKVWEHVLRLQWSAILTNVARVAHSEQCGGAQALTVCMLVCSLTGRTRWLGWKRQGGESSSGMATGCWGCWPCPERLVSNLADL